MSEISDNIGVVVIGRNEGERLACCLRSVLGSAHAVVYVDSGSTDGSVELARAMGARIVELDTSIPFSAARARNQGLELLLRSFPDIQWVQFVDGDSEIVVGWLQAGATHLREQEKVAAVCGRLRERFPTASIYNRLCNMEWNAPSGQVKACGGIAMYRVAAFQQVGGFDPGIVAGEEPELCMRLRARGWTVVRLKDEMGLHDAAMTRLGQWWKRGVRSGHAYAEGAWLHGRSSEHYNLRPVISAMVWGFLAPLILLASLIAALWRPWMLLPGAIVILGMLAVAFRAHRFRRRIGDSFPDATLYSVMILVAKSAQCMGIARFLKNRLANRQAMIIEYKAPAAAAANPK